MVKVGAIQIVSCIEDFGSEKDNKNANLYL
jgi:hypothetical protein